MKTRLILVFSTLMFSVATGYAAVQTFDLVNAAFLDGTATATGTVSVDTAAGLVTGVNIAFSDSNPNFGRAIFSSVIGQSSFDNGTDYFFDSIAPTGQQLSLEVREAGLVGYAGGPICVQTSALRTGNCGSISYVGLNATTANPVLNPFTDGDLVLAPVAGVPEPASYMTLALGLLALAGSRHWLPRRRAKG